MVTYLSLSPAEARVWHLLHARGGGLHRACELAAAVRCSQRTLWRALSALRARGLVEWQPLGRGRVWVTSLTPPPVSADLSSLLAAPDWVSRFYLAWLAGEVRSYYHLTPLARRKIWENFGERGDLWITQKRRSRRTR